MTEQDMVSLLTPVGYVETTANPAWGAFVQFMERRQYGYEALSSAWSWFQTGYHCGVSATKAEVKRLLSPPMYGKTRTQTGG